MKKITKVIGWLGSVVVVSTVLTTAHAWAKDHFQGDILESVAATFNITDSNLAQSKSNSNRKKFIEAMEKAVKDIESQEVRDRLRDLKRQWELDRKRLNNAIKTRQEMIAGMANRKTVRTR